MSAFIEIGRLKIPAASNTSGVFSGQNMQSNWDAHMSTFTSLSAIMGSDCSINAGYVRALAVAKVGQPTYDSDDKLNNTPMRIR